MATLDLFLTHAWRYHGDWQRMVDMLNADLHSWRNFSLPWYDPALDVRTPEGSRAVRWQLETQIIPCHAVILLGGVHEQPSSRKWVEFEIELARKHRKPVIAVPSSETALLAPETRALADATAEWTLDSVFAAARDAAAATVAVTP